MSWASRRKLLYLSVVALVGIFVILFFFQPLINKAPTCVDGKQNSDEKGVDCGGSCEFLCKSQVKDVSVLWSRAFNVSAGVYDVLIYAENKNVNAGVKNILYKIKMYDENNILIAERDGKTYISPNEKIPIFEGNIKTKERDPKRVFVEFLDGYAWSPVGQKSQEIKLSVEDKELTETGTTPKLKATVKNNSVYDIPQVDIVAIIYDADDNAIAVSKTVVKDLKTLSAGSVFFTWLKPFEKQVSRIEILPRVNFFSVKF